MENITNNSNPFLYKNVLFNENNLNQNYMDQITDDKNKGIYENSLSIKKQKHSERNSDINKKFQGLLISDKVSDSNHYYNNTSSPKKYN